MDQLPPEIIEAILNNFPLSREGLTDLIYTIRALNYIPTDEFWRILYRQKIDSEVLIPPLNTWKDSYTAYIFNHKEDIHIESVSDILTYYNLRGQLVLRVGLAGHTIEGNSFNLQYNDHILTIGEEGDKINIVYNPYLLRRNIWINYYIERDLPIPEVPGAEIRTADTSISFLIRLTLQIGD